MIVSRTIIAAVALSVAALGSNAAFAQQPLAQNSQTDYRFNFWTGRWEVVQNTQQLYGSAFDPNRNVVVDPGSYQFVDQYYIDANGQQVHVTGPKWTSLGVPHDNLTYETVSQGAGIDILQRTTTTRAAEIDRSGTFTPADGQSGATSRANGNVGRFGRPRPGPAFGGGMFRAQKSDSPFRGFGRRFAPRGSR